MAQGSAPLPNDNVTDTERGIPMRFAIYSRKSKFTGKGESVENQVQLCKDYIEQRYGKLSDHVVEVFEDEGFSGKNLDRPEFQRMQALAHKRQFDYIVCYRLDRISRNVSDFSSLIEDLQHYKVSFICIKEQFDTSTPMGRAMMYIASVFAQLERETIAERIRDNMLLLARTGRWLGGTTPLGFESTKVAKETIDGKIKTSFMLAPVKEEQDKIRIIYAKFLEVRSLTKVETYLIQQGTKTRQNKDFTIIALREILSNPVFCVADDAAYKYFISKDADVCYEQKEFDGSHGIAAYNRTKHDGKFQIKNEINHWIIAVGKHKGIITSTDWIAVQKTLETNRPKKYAGRVLNQASLLSGLLVCNSCGSFLRPRVNSNKRRGKDGNQTYAYLCELKKKSKAANCNIPNINGNELDKVVCEEILKFDVEGSLVYEKLASLKKNLSNGGSVSQIALESVKKQIAEKKKQIDELIIVLGKSSNIEALFEHTSKMVEDLDQQLQQLKKEEFRLEEEVAITGDYDSQVGIIYDALKSFSKSFYTASVPEKRAFLRSVIEKIVWDGKEIHIFLFGES